MGQFDANRTGQSLSNAATVIAKEAVLLQGNGAGHVGFRCDRFVVDHRISRQAFAQRGKQARRGNRHAVPAALALVLFESAWSLGAEPQLAVSRRPAGARPLQQLPVTRVWGRPTSRHPPAYFCQSPKRNCRFAPANSRREAPVPHCRKLRRIDPRRRRAPRRYRLRFAESRCVPPAVRLGSAGAYSESRVRR